MTITGKTILGLAVLFAVSGFLQVTYAQRNFTRRQQAGFLAFSQMEQQRLQRQRQQEQQRLNQRFQQQQGSIRDQNLRLNAVTRGLIMDENGEEGLETVKQIIRRSSLSARGFYGNMHFGGPFQRITPYYDVGFIRTRGR